MFKKTCVSSCLSGVALKSSLSHRRLVSSSSSSTVRSFHQSYSLNQHREKLKVGFIGLGQMGARYVHKVKLKQHDLLVPLNFV